MLALDVRAVSAEPRTVGPEGSTLQREAQPPQTAKAKDEKKPKKEKKAKKAKKDKAKDKTAKKDTAAKAEPAAQDPDAQAPDEGRFATDTDAEPTPPLAEQGGPSGQGVRVTW